MDDRTYALPAAYYRDPAETIELLEMDRLGCRACVSFGLVLGRPHCADERNAKQAGVPRIGHRCKYFDERR